MSDLYTPAYPFDPTGKLASNKIVNEQQILTESNGVDYHLIVPTFAPYFSESLIVSIKTLTNEVVVLNEGVDYLCSHWFVAASRSCATPIYGSISILDNSLAGVVSISYQTLGGIWSVDLDHIAAILSDVIHNPRITSWDEVIDKPITFPPIDHEWNLNDLVGAKEIVTSINGIRDSLIQNQTGALNTHLLDSANPHSVTANQVGSYTRAEVDFLIASVYTNIAATSGNNNDATALDTAYFMGRP